MAKSALFLAGASVAGFIALPVTPSAAATTGGTTPVSTVVPAATAQLAKDCTRGKKLKTLAVLTAKTAMNPQWWNYRDAANQGKAPCRFDWSTDYCSKAPDEPGGFKFQEPCARHDFAYRNYKKLHMLSKEIRLRVDKAFLYDMKFVCGAQFGFYEWQRAACRKTAKKYYQSIRTFGYLNP